MIVYNGNSKYIEEWFRQENNSFFWMCLILPSIGQTSLIEKLLKEINTIDRLTSRHVAFMTFCQSEIGSEMEELNLEINNYTFVRITSCKLYNIRACYSARVYDDNIRHQIARDTLETSDIIRKELNLVDSSSYLILYCKILDHPICLKLDEQLSVEYIFEVLNPFWLQSSEINEKVCSLNRNKSLLMKDYKYYGSPDIGKVNNELKIREIECSFSESMNKILSSLDISNNNIYSIYQINETYSFKGEYVIVDETILHLNDKERRKIAKTINRHREKLNQCLREKEKIANHENLLHEIEEDELLLLSMQEMVKKSIIEQSSKIKLSSLRYWIINIIIRIIDLKTTANY